MSALLYNDFGKLVPALPRRLHDGRLEAELPHLSSPGTTYVVDSPLSSFMGFDPARETLEYLQTAIEHAPSHPGQLAPDLRGWWTPDGWYLCAKCAGRIMSRGCRLPPESYPVWTDRPEPYGVCCCCDK
jgi:hypothetical protein